MTGNRIGTNQRHTFMRFLPLIVALGLAVAACSGGDSVVSPTSSDSVVSPTSSDTPPAATDQVRAVLVGDVWVFHRDSVSGDDARHVGTAEIRNGCLFVGDSLVVWKTEDLQRVEGIVSDVQAGTAIQVELGGGGRSLDEGSTLDDFPEAIIEHCETSTIFYGRFPDSES